MDFSSYAKIVEKLVEYTQYHFYSKEKMMLESGIDKRHYASHVKKHQDFIKEIFNANSSIKSADLKKMHSLNDFLINWLAYHILITDHNMASQIKSIKSGVSPKEAYDLEEKKSTKSVEPLLEALSSLAEQLSQRNQELVDLNKSLEQKVKQRTKELTDTNKTLEELTLTDSLTKLSNRRHCMRELSLLWEESVSLNLPLSCIVIDLDYFKIVNDTCGHDSGDMVLCLFARELLYSVRSDDIVCRLGGDEFIVLCPNTHKEGVRHLAKQIHKNISELKLELSHMVYRGSASIGLASRKPKMIKYEELIKLADKNAYRAKQDGRNCVRG